MPLNKAKRKAASNLKNIFGYEELSSGYSVNFLKPNSFTMLFCKNQFQAYEKSWKSAQNNKIIIIAID